MKKIIVSIFIILCVILIVLVLLKYTKKKDSAANDKENNEINETKQEQVSQDILEENGDKMTSSIKVIIDEIKYDVILEENETTKAFLKMLPLNINMKELNGNEKYAYLNTELPIAPYKLNHIEKGDIMLYGNNCLVIFYKSFDTSYSYTKIGHIENLKELNNKEYNISFIKE